MPTWGPCVSSSRLIAAIDAVADEEGYPSYRLDLVPAASTSDRLLVDDSFAGSADETDVLGNWFATTGALLGDVRYRFEPGQEAIELDSGAGILHDVSEASRIGYGFDDHGVDLPRRRELVRRLRPGLTDRREPVPGDRAHRVVGGAARPGGDLAARAPGQARPARPARGAPGWVGAAGAADGRAVRRRRRASRPTGDERGRGVRAAGHPAPGRLRPGARGRVRLLGLRRPAGARPGPARARLGPWLVRLAQQRA